MRPHHCGAIGILALVAAAPAYGGGWTQEPGAHYLKIWNRSIIGSRAILTDGSVAALPGTYQSHQLQLYGEFGLSDGLTWVGYVNPVGVAGFDQAIRPFVGPAWTGVRLRLAQGGRFVLSAQASVGGRVPVGATTSFDGSLDGTRAFVRPTAGTGQGDAELQLGVGLGSFWASLSAGVRGFTSPTFSPALYSYAQLGWDSGRNVILDLHLPLYFSLARPTEIDVLGITNTRYLGAGITGSYWFTERFAITASAEGVALAASNAATPSLNLGVELR